MESFLTNFSEAHRLLSYLIIFLVVFIEGEVILLLAGILARHGYLGLFTVFSIAFAASILHDLLYWSIGRRLAARKRPDNFLFFNLDKAKNLLASFGERNGFYIFISKFSWGLTRLVLVASGYMKMPIRNVWKYTIPAGFIWTISLISLGYAFASETNLLRKDIKTATLLVTAFVLAILALEYIIRKSIKRGVE